MTPNLWQQLFADHLSGLDRKARWDWLRRGKVPNDPGWQSLQGHWNIASRHTAADARVTKLRLESIEHRDACETVVMRPRPTRGTVCISTQVGCGVGCLFCATGRMGWVRNLTPSEILEQVLLAKTEVHAWSLANDQTIHLRNVVLMGMGEPLHNDTAVAEAIEFMIADRGFGFSPRHITLSTVGIPGKMIAMAQRFPRLRIALSLHAANRPLRRQLVPRATDDLESLRETIAELNRIDPEEPVWIEYALLSGVNDQDEHARELIAFCQNLRVEINLIPYNDTSHANTESKLGDSTIEFLSPSRESARRFAQILRDAGLFTTLRNTLGDSIQAACGQLIARGIQPSP